MNHARYTIQFHDPHKEQVYAPRTLACFCCQKRAHAKYDTEYYVICLLWSMACWFLVAAATVCGAIAFIYGMASWSDYSAEARLEDIQPVRVPLHLAYSGVRKGACLTCTYQVDVTNTMPDCIDVMRQFVAREVENLVPCFTYRCGAMKVDSGKQCMYYDTSVAWQQPARSTIVDSANCNLPSYVYACPAALPQCWTSGTLDFIEPMQKGGVSVFCVNETAPPNSNCVVPGWVDPTMPFTLRAAGAGCIEPLGVPNADTGASAEFNEWIVMAGIVLFPIATSILLHPCMGYTMFACRPFLSAWIRNPRNIRLNRVSYLWCCVVRREATVLDAATSDFHLLPRSRRFQCYSSLAAVCMLWLLILLGSAVLAGGHITMALMWRHYYEHEYADYKPQAVTLHVEQLQQVQADVSYHCEPQHPYVTYTYPQCSTVLLAMLQTHSAPSNGTRCLDAGNVCVASTNALYPHTITLFALTWTVEGEEAWATYATFASNALMWPRRDGQHILSEMHLLPCTPPAVGEKDGKLCDVTAWSTLAAPDKIHLAKPAEPHVNSWPHIIIVTVWCGWTGVTLTVLCLTLLNSAMCKKWHLMTRAIGTTCFRWALPREIVAAHELEAAVRLQAQQRAAGVRNNLSSISDSESAHSEDTDDSIEVELQLVPMPNGVIGSS